MWTQSRCAPLLLAVFQGLLCRLVMLSKYSAVSSAGCSPACLVSQAVAAVAGVSAMPTFQVWQKGGKVDELVGASKEKLKAMIEKYA